MKALRELPWLIGIAIGLYLYWRHGWAFVLDGQPDGYQWDDYIENAWMVVHQMDLGYARFRHPLHGALVGFPGEWTGSYVNAAILVSSIGALMMVLAAALAGRALAGPWAGALGAVLVPTVQVTLTAGRWSNLYTTLAGTSVLSLALAAVFCRWPRGWLALLAGALGGIAYGIDSRGLAFAPAALLLVLMGLFRAEGWLRRGLLLLLFVLPFWVGPASVDALWIDGVGRPQPVEQLRFQRKVFLRWATHGHYETGMPAACSDEDSEALPSLAGFQTDCARAMAGFNFGSVFQRFLPLPAGFAVAGGLLALLPRRRRREDPPSRQRLDRWLSPLESLAFFGLGLLPMVVFAWWMPIPDRYMVQFATPLALLGPVGLMRGLRLVLPGRMGAAGAGIGSIGLLVVAWTADPTSRFQTTTVQASPYEQGRRLVAARVGERMGPTDVIVDCADLHIPARWLPHRVPDPPMFRLDDRFCLDWMANPPSDRTAWLLLDEKLSLGGLPAPIDPNQQGRGWEQVGAEREVQIWRHPLNLEGTGPPPPTPATPVAPPAGL